MGLLPFVRTHLLRYWRPDLPESDFRAIEGMVKWLTEAAEEYRSGGLKTDDHAALVFRGLAYELQEIAEDLFGELVFESDFAPRSSKELLDTYQADYSRRMARHLALLAAHLEEAALPSQERLKAFKEALPYEGLFLESGLPVFRFPPAETPLDFRTGGGPIPEVLQEVEVLKEYLELLCHRLQRFRDSLKSETRESVEEAENLSVELSELSGQLREAASFTRVILEARQQSGGSEWRGER
ncbi:MAG: hypothetical protein ACLF0P_04295 [Thermoanaerobaculia bacterium]